MDFSKLFDQFNTQDSYAILFIMLIAFLFGLLLGYLLRSRRVMTLRRELKDKEKELAEARIELEALQDQLALKEADLKKAGFAVQEAEAQVARIEEEKGQLHREIFQLNRKIEELQASGQSYSTTIEDLNRQIAERDQQIESLKEHFTALNQQLESLQSHNMELSSTLEEEDQSLNNFAQMQSIYNATRHRLEAMEAHLERLDGENAELRQELKKIQSSPSLAEQSMAPGQDTSEPLEISSLHPYPGMTDASVVEQEPEVSFSSEKKIIQEKIILPGEAPEQDDLTRIDGIGPFLEKKLNEIGVYTYDEIAAWDSERIREVTAAIEYFEGRIERDNWVEQAAHLAMKKLENPEAFRKDPSGALSNDPEDLKVIEGVGPKIEELLKNAGIINWADLADADVEQLNAILEAAGASFRMHDPATWPTQARLANNGEWNLLREYQDELKGGREVGPE